MINVLVCGVPHGSYRNQNFFKFLATHYEKVSTSYTDRRYKINFTCSSMFCKITRKILKLFIDILIFPMYLIRVVQSDVVYVLAMNHTNCFMTILLGKLFRKKVIIDYYISMYDSLVLDSKSVTNIWSVKKLFYKEQLIMKLADELIFLNYAEQKYYCELLKVENIKFKIIPLCIDPHIYRESALSLNEKQKPIICWWGTYIPLHGLFNIIEAVELLKEEGFEGKFYFFGNSKAAAQQYQERIIEKRLENEITIINDYTFNNGKLEHFLYENCDLALGSFGESAKAKTVLINKVLDAISMKIPVLTMKTKASEEFFSFEDDIFVTKTESPNEIAEQILRIFDNYEKVQDNVERSYQIYLDNFSPKVYMKKLEEVVSDS